MEVAGLPSAWCACPALAAGRAEHLRGNNSVMNINEVAQQAAIVLPVYDLQIRVRYGYFTWLWRTIQRLE